MTLPWAMFEVAVNMFQCAVTLYFGLCIFPLRKRNTLVWWYIVPAWIIDATLLSLYTFIPMPSWLPNIVPSTIIFLLWTGIFRTDSLLQKILWALIYFAVYAGNTYLTMTIALSLPGVTSDLLASYTYIRVIYVLTVNAAHFFAIILLIQIAKRLENSVLNMKVTAVSCILVVINLLLLVLLIEVAVILPSGTVPPVFLIFSAIALTAVNMLVLWMFRYINEENARLMKAQAESQLMELQLGAESNYRRMDEELRQFRHDHLSLLQYMKAQIGSGAYEEALQFLDKSLNELTDFAIIETGNAQMNYIISGKAMQAETKGISMDIDMMLPAEMDIEDTDLLHLMSNLLDNAIEACMMILNKESAVITVQGMVVQGTLSVLISNPMVSVPKKKGVYAMTAKANSNWHGLGLHIVDKVITKYGGHLEIKQQNYSYTVIFAIPIESAQI